VTKCLDGYFDYVDMNHDGFFTLHDLEIFVRNYRWEVTPLLNHCLSVFAEVGSVDQRLKSDPKPLLSIGSGSLRSLLETPVITRKDVSTYQDRMKEKYRTWLSYV